MELDRHCRCTHAISCSSRNVTGRRWMEEQLCLVFPLHCIHQTVRQFVHRGLPVFSISFLVVSGDCGGRGRWERTISWPSFCLHFIGHKQFKASCDYPVPLEAMEREYLFLLSCIGLCLLVPYPYLNTRLSFAVNRVPFTSIIRVALWMFNYATSSIPNQFFSLKSGEPDNWDNYCQIILIKKFSF